MAPGHISEDRYRIDERMPDCARGRRRRAQALVGAMLIGATVLTACGTGTDAVSAVRANQFVSPDGQTVIDYAPAMRRAIGAVEGEDLFDRGAVRLADYRGDVVVVNVWASWCPPCRTEFQALENVYRDTRARGVQFVGINFRDSRSTAQDFTTDRKVPYRSIFDYGGATLAALGVPVGVVPTTLILDRQHRPAKLFLRAITEAELRAAVLTVAEEKAAPK